MLSHANMWLGAVSVAHYLRLAPEDRVLAVLPFSFDYGQNQLFSTWAAGACGRAARLSRRAGRDPGNRTPSNQYLGWRSSALGSTDRGALAGRGRAVAAPPDQQRRQARALGGPADARGLSGRRHLFDVRPHRGLPLDLSRARPARRPSRFDGRRHSLRRDHGGRRRRRARRRRASWSMPGPWSPRAIGRIRRAPPSGSSRRRPAPLMAAWRSGRATGCAATSEGLLYFVGREDGMIKTSGNRVSPTEVEEAALGLGPGRRGGGAGLSRRAAGRGDRPDRPPRPPRRGGGLARLPEARNYPISCSPARSSGATNCRAARTASSTGWR